MNQIADLCERVGADVHDVRRGIGSDAASASAFLFPGPGYGGSCFPKDVKALHPHGRRRWAWQLDLLEAVEAGERAPEAGAGREDRWRALGSDLTGRAVAVWGLAFKAQTDDMRESPRIPLIEDLLAAGARVQAHDPEAMARPRGRLRRPRGTMPPTPTSALHGADALVVVTEWQVYRLPTSSGSRSLMRPPGDLRRPQPLRAGAGWRRRASPTTASDGEWHEGPDHRRRRVPRLASGGPLPGRRPRGRRDRQLRHRHARTTSRT